MKISTLRRASIAGLVLATLASVPVVNKFNDISSYLHSDVNSELSREATAGKPKGITSLTTLEEHVKTARDFALYTINDISDNKKEYDLVVNKTRNEMEIYLDGILVRRMKVATGLINQPNKTKFGEYVTPNGDYMYIHFKDKQTIIKQFGRNAAYYGDGMLQLSGPWAPHIAVHGTDDEAAIGQYTTNGCIRVSNENVRWLRDNLGIGSRIRVFGSSDTPTQETKSGYSPPPEPH